MPEQRDGKDGLSGVPLRERQRLAKVLEHLAASRQGDECSGDCGTCLRSTSCSSHGGKKHADIEELPGQRGSADEGCGGLGGEAGLFDPRRYRETMRPLLEASTLPRECYTSEAWFARECERVFVPSWTLMGRLDELSEPGSYLAIDTEWGGPVAVVLGSSGEVHAFANVCCHRGAKVLQAGSGRAPKVGLVCPYHAWTYNFDGTLKWAPGTEQVKDFKVEDVRLAPIRVEVFQGFIFVCASGESRPLLETLGDLPERLAPWFGPDGQAKDMVTVGRRDYTVDCNWKFLMENTCETYHTSTVHKNSLGPMKATPELPHRGAWDAVEVPSQRSVVPLPSDFKGERFPLPAFTDRTAFVNLFPSLQINVTWDCLWWMRLFPLSAARTHIQMGFCFPRETVALPSFPAALERYLVRWHTAVTEDNAISLNQQRGVRSRFRVPGRFAPLEFGTHNFNNWLLSKTLDGGASWDPGQRVHVGDGEMWSNDDGSLLDVIKEAEQAK